MLENKKQKGNDAFGEGRLQDAFDLYSEALAVDPEHREMNRTLYSNRAATLMKVKILKNDIFLIM